MNAAEFETRAKSVRRKILSSVFRAKKGHLGGALSITDFLLFIYSNGFVQPHPGGRRSRVQNPLVLSKAHSATALLAVMEEQFPDRAHPLEDYNADGSLVGNNPCEAVFGVEFHAGSLGHGLGYGAGLALGSRLAGGSSCVHVVVSDGELNEGSCWESLLFIAQHRLNICVTVDQNNQICETYTDDAVGLGDLKAKGLAFGFKVAEVDGHSFEQLSSVSDFLSKEKSPRLLILNTIKGKGVSFMERVIRFHHSIPTRDEFELAMKELT